MLTRRLHRRMMVVCFACCIFGMPITAFAQEIVISSYTDSWTDLDTNPEQQVFYAEVFDQSNIPPGVYHADHYSWATAESTVSSGTDAGEGGGGGPYWLAVETNEEVEDEFVLMTFMRLFCSGLQDYVQGGGPIVQFETWPVQAHYNYIGANGPDENFLYSYGVDPDSSSLGCAKNILFHPYHYDQGKMTAVGLITYHGENIFGCSIRCTEGHLMPLKGISPGSTNLTDPKCRVRVN